MATDQRPFAPDHDTAECLRRAADEVEAGLYDDSVGPDAYLASLARIERRRAAADTASTVGVLMTIVSRLRYWYGYHVHCRAYDAAAASRSPAVRAFGRRWLD
jgi:hypothetical protein